MTMKGTMSTIVVGFGHRARHGKDTVVSTIIEKFKSKYDVRRYAFADALKREVEESATACGGFPQLVTWLKAEHNLSDWVELEENPDMTDPMCPSGKHRTLLQWWGTEHRRAKDPHYWVKQLENKIKADNPQFALVSDMRFKNEFYWVKSHTDNGYTIKVERLNFNDPKIKNDHPSETDLAKVEFDIHIQAIDGELDHLKQCAVGAFEHILTNFAVDEEKLDFTLPALEKELNEQA